MNTLKLTCWSIRRSGAGLAVTGIDATGAERKVTRIAQIHAARTGGYPFGHGRGPDGDDVRVELALA